ncbi:CMD-domain-containing protein [Pseudohyphozyma bogoriensis]|nr:CMD-domain-containing protein [Pseudohyphozyma bogoriensis]
MSDTKALEAARKTLYDEGMIMRRKVMGDEYVDAALSKGASEFAVHAQMLATEAAWGTIWTRPGLELKQRSLVTLSLLGTLGKLAELQGHVVGALRNGLTEEEIREVMLHVIVYAGLPAGLEAFRACDEALKKYKASH